MENDSLLPSHPYEQFFSQLVPIVQKTSPRACDFLQRFREMLIDPFIFDNKQCEQCFLFVHWKYPIANPTGSPLCSKSIANCINKKAFRCFDCMEINTALLCYDCFVNGNHKGHTFLEFQSAGGCCDCGDTSCWNEEGFCPSHSNKNQKADIPLELKQVLIGELGLVYYLYFWCIQNEDDFKEITSIYGDNLFEYANIIIQQNFQTKTLMAELMKSSLKAYPPLSSIKDTILSSIFHLKIDNPVLQKFRKFAFQMYPVELMRAQMLGEYFQLTKSNTFTWQHPIKKFNFQYMTCVKTINRLIRQKKMAPLQLDPTSPPNQTSVLVSIFKKYYQDLNYLRKMKDSREYCQLHLQLTNASDMAFYRQHSSITKNQTALLDQYYLKSLTATLRLVIQRKDLLAKGMKELFDYVLMNKGAGPTFSLAQERGFAAFVVAFLHGDLEKLKRQQILNEIFQILRLKPETAANILRDLIKRHIKDFAILGKHSDLKPERNTYENYFYSEYPQKEFPLQLDLLYHKILLLLGRNLINYPLIIEYVIDQQLQDEVSDQPHQQISQISSFIARIAIQDVDEVTVSNSLGITHKQRITQTYLKVISSYANKFTVKQLKFLCSYLISNPEVFESTLKQFTIFENGKLTVNAPCRNIEKYIFMDLLKGLKHYQQIKWEPVNSAPLIKLLRDCHIFSEGVISSILKNAKSIIENIEYATSNPQNFKKTLERQIYALLQIYLLTQSSQIKQFFTQSLQNIRKSVYSQLFNHINVICKQRDKLIFQQQEGQKQRVDDARRKRQKVQQKRKQKQILMKKNQQLMLKQYNAKKQQVQHNQDNELCIYCKEQIKEDYQILVYISLTNLISKFLLKHQKVHMFAIACGHKVHQECYVKYGEQKKQEHVYKCFLCKKKSNFVLPNPPQIIEEGERETILIKFLDSIYAMLVSEAQSSKRDELFNEFLEQQEQGCILRIVLRSIVREAVYYGLHLFESFKRSSLNVYQQIYKFIKLAKVNQIGQHLDKLIKENNYINHPLITLQKYAYYLLKKQLVGDATEKPINLDIDPQTINNLQKLLSIIINPKAETAEIVNSSIISRQNLMRALPVSISELHQSMGQCPFCKKISNWIYYCTLCEWRACNKQTQAFHKHSKQQHLQGSVFVSAGNGKTSVISCGYAKNEDSLYENSYEECYVHNDDNYKKNYLNSFKLNSKRYEKFYGLIMSHTLHNLVG